MIERFDGLRSGGGGLLLAIALSGPLAGACGGAEGPGSRLASGSHDEAISHEACEGGSIQSVDTNGDGKPDIQHVTKDGREVCRVVDLNRDGKPDLYEYFDATGAIRRREFCYDETGAVNAIETYERGKLVERQYDISGQHRIDTWDWFDPNAPVDPKTGRPVHPTRRERDTTGDGRVDQWWTWDGDKVTIAVDRTGDGKPDPDATIVLGAGSGAPGEGAPTGSGAPQGTSDAGAGASQGTSDAGAGASQGTTNAGAAVADASPSTENSGDGGK